MAYIKRAISTMLKSRVKTGKCKGIFRAAMGKVVSDYG